MASLQNFLPYRLIVKDEKVSETIELEPGASHHVTHSHIVDSCHLSVELASYRGHNWHGSFSLGILSISNLATISLTSDEGKMEIAVFSSDNGYSREISFYAPYWFMNKTEQPLYLQIEGKNEPIVNHEMYSSDQGPILYTNNREQKDRMRKVRVQVADSEWSEVLPLDAVGTVTEVVCYASNDDHFESNSMISNKWPRPRRPGTAPNLLCCTTNQLVENEDRRKYPLVMANTITSSKLTEIITFSPRYFLVNKCAFQITCKEVGFRKKYTIDNGKVIVLSSQRILNYQVYIVFSIGCFFLASNFISKQCSNGGFRCPSWTNFNQSKIPLRQK